MCLYIKFILTGYLSIQFPLSHPSKSWEDMFRKEVPPIKSLDFLSNLEIVHGRTRSQLDSSFAVSSYHPSNTHLPPPFDLEVSTLAFMVALMIYIEWWWLRITIYKNHIITAVYCKIAKYYDKIITSMPFIWLSSKLLRVSF